MPENDSVAITARRLETEQRLRTLLRKNGSDATLEQITTMIFEEDPDRASFGDYVRVLLHVIGGSPDDALPVIEDAWNYFPHRRLDGRCPAELFFADPGSNPPAP